MDDLKGSSGAGDEGTYSSVGDDLTMTGALAPGDLADALESLRTARAENDRLRREVAGVREQFSVPSRVDARGLQGGEVKRLEGQIESLTTLLHEGKRAAVVTSQRLQGSVGGLKHNMDQVRSEVRSLTHSTELAEQRCAVAAEEVRQLKAKLGDVCRERDEISTKLMRFMSDVRATMKELRTEMEAKERDLDRLNEQNTYLRAQLGGRKSM